MKSIFISRSLDSDSVFFKELSGNKFTIIDLPLIDIVKIPFSYTPQVNWIFFTSKNSIKYFFEQNPTVSENVKYGIISQASEKTLRYFGKHSTFVGNGVDLAKIAKDFRQVLGNDSVLFPQAMDSLQTIQKYLAFTNTTHNLYTYKTILKTEFELPYTDIVVFTSPSNVKAYFSKYKLDPRQLVVAMGSSTKFKLAEYGAKDVLTPMEFNESSICELIKENLFEMNKNI